MVSCDVCGNEISQDTVCCPFCGTRQLQEVQRKKLGHRVVNLEKGMPVVDQALQRLEQELALAKAQGYQLITFIHGYGSSGQGGAIRRAVRRRLEDLVVRQQLKLVVPGELLNRHAGAGRLFFKRFPDLMTAYASRRENPGITVVVL